MIEIDSDGRSGTTVRILLEVTSESPESVHHPDRTVRKWGQDGKGRMVVVVEDEEALRGVVCRALKRSGYKTSEAGDGEAALQLLAGGAVSADLVITDIGLPDMDGLTLADRIREFSPDVPVLYTSGHSEEDVIRRFAVTRPRIFLEKPYSVERLLEKVAETIALAQA